MSQKAQTTPYQPESSDSYERLCFSLHPAMNPNSLSSGRVTVELPVTLSAQYIAALTERFFRKVTVTDDCWLWTGGIAGQYGQFRCKDKRVPAHRFSYEMFVGPIPEGLFVDHLCCVKRCVKPTHLEPVTHAENMRRARRSNDVHCANGHAWTPENSYTSKAGYRVCRVCSKGAGKRSTIKRVLQWRAYVEASRG